MKLPDLLRQPTTTCCWWCTEPFPNAPVAIPVRYNWHDKGRGEGGRGPTPAPAATTYNPRLVVERPGRRALLQDAYERPLSSFGSKINRFELHGIFCSWPCARSFSRHRMHQSGHVEDHHTYLMRVLQRRLAETEEHAASRAAGAATDARAPCPFKSLAKFGGRMGIQEFRSTFVTGQQARPRRGGGTSGGGSRGFRNVEIIHDLVVPDDDEGGGGGAVAVEPGDGGGSGGKKRRGVDDKKRKRGGGKGDNNNNTTKKKKKKQKGATTTTTTTPATAADDPLPSSSPLNFMDM